MVYGVAMRKRMLQLKARVTGSFWPNELAHMAHAELYTPDLEGSLWFFTQLLGMRETASHQGSVYLRCYEDP